MIELQTGNLLEADAEALVNTVNCVGVMGKGIALQFKQAFSDNYREYQKACKDNRVRPGKMFIVSTGLLVNPKYIINFPTKRHWKGQSLIEDIEAGLQSLIEDIKAYNIESIAVPPLGCGNGGLEWAEVAPIIVKAFDQLPRVSVQLFEPLGTPSAISMPVATNKPKMTRGRALIIILMQQYGIPGYELSKLEIQKLAYFLQIAGEPLKLRYVKHKYGPYADNVNHVMQTIEGHYTRGYGDGSQQWTGIHLLPKAAEEASHFLEPFPDAAAHLKRVSQLIEGFETPYAMELLATVHWVTQHDLLAAVDPAVAITGVHSWSKRKEKLFPPENIYIAWQRLHDENWLPISH